MQEEVELGKKRMEINKDCPCLNLKCQYRTKCSDCQAFHERMGGTPACKKLEKSKKEEKNKKEENDEE